MTPPPQNNIRRQRKPNARAKSYSAYVRDINGEPEYPLPNTTREKRKPTARTVEERQRLYDEQIAKIKPQTIVWIQGRPTGKDGQTNVPLWKVLPPPYKQEDLFTMRQTPPSAIDNGQGSIYDTLQVIGGQLTQPIDIALGHIAIKVTPNGDKPRISIRHTVNSNAGQRSQTIGMGHGQIPLTEWYKAKAQGISLSDFKALYASKQQITQS